MKRRLIVIAALAALTITGCSALTNQETQQSNLPSAANLKQMCLAGPSQSPPVARPGACDDYNAIQTGCVALSSQPLVPAGALQACIAAGYAVSGSWTPL